MNVQPEKPIRIVMDSLREQAQRFLPPPLVLQAGEQWRIVLGALLGILFTGLVSRWVSPQAAVWMVAPIGTVALLAVLSHSQSWGSVLFPVLFNSVLLVLVGLVFNGLSGHPYPHRQRAQKQPPETDSSLRFTRADLDAALQHYNELVDIAPEDLIALLQLTEAAAYQRTLGELRCSDIMTPDPHCVQFGTELGFAWALMRKRRVKALPVVDKTQRVVGIVTVADFLNQAGIAQHEGLVDRLQNMLKPTGLTHTEKPEVVGQIMTRKVRVARAQRHAVELLPLFSEEGHHHLPIVDDDNRVVGILTQSDLVRSLRKAVRP